MHKLQKDTLMFVLGFTLILQQTASAQLPQQTGLPIVTHPKAPSPAEISFTKGTITAHGMTVNGRVISLGAWPYMVPVVQGDTSSYAPGQGSLKAPGEFSIAINGLNCNTSYNFYGYGTDGSTATSTTPLAFKTAPCSTQVSGGKVTSITETTAVINGTILSSPTYPVTPSFKVSGGTLGLIGPASVASANTNFSANLTGLTCDTTYSFVAKGTSSEESGEAPSISFATLPCVMVVTASGATAITATSAVINGKIDHSTTFPVTPSFTTSNGTLGKISSSSITKDGTAFSATLTNLTCGKAYTYTALGTNAAGRKFPSTSQSFNTVACPAASITFNVSSITASGIVVKGSVSSMGAWPYVVPVVQGSAMSYAPGQGSLKTPGEFSISINGLTCNTAYNFYGYGTDGYAATPTTPLGFKTRACPIGGAQNTNSAPAKNLH